jgi:predicted transcriptional regulator
MLNMSTIDINHIYRSEKKEEYAPRNFKKAKVERKVYPPAQKSIDKIHGILTRDDMTVAEIEVKSRFCQTFIYRVLRVLESQGVIVRTKKTGDSGRLETYIRLKV